MQGSGAPMFRCEATKGLVMNGVCRNVRKEQRRDKRSKTHYHVQCDHTQGKTQDEEEMHRQVKQQFGKVRSSYLSLFAQRPTMSTVTANTRCMAGVPRGQHRAQLSLHLHKWPLRGGSLTSTPGPRCVPALHCCIPNIYNRARHTAGAR